MNIVKSLIKATTIMTMGLIREDAKSPSKGSAELLHPRDVLCSERGCAGQCTVSRCGFTAREHEER